MNYIVNSFHQGTSDSDPSLVEIVVQYLGRSICFSTFLELDWTIAQDSDDYLAALETVAASVLVACPNTVPNPDYDPSLTACWT